MPKSSSLHQLTHLSIRNLVKDAKNNEKPRVKTDGGNLYITVSRTGHISWVFRYQWYGRGRERTLDEVDTTQKDYGLIHAREVAAEFRNRVKKGEDVAANKLEEKMGGADTFKSVAEDWYKKSQKHFVIPR